MFCKDRHVHYVELGPEPVKTVCLLNGVIGASDTLRYTAIDINQTSEGTMRDVVEPIVAARGSFNYMAADFHSVTAECLNHGQDITLVTMLGFQEGNELPVTTGRLIRNLSAARSLSDIGYTSSPHSAIDVRQITAVSEVRGLLAQPAITALQIICRQLEFYADNSDWIISRRTRGVTELSPFIAAMMNSRSFLLSVSRIAGVPLVPYPMINARFQINYYFPVTATHQHQQLGMWHTDGTNYVLNIVLSGRQEYTGGEFLFHNGTIDTFDQTAEHQPRIEVASLPAAGDALFIYGSRLFHGVKPVLEGQRMSLVLSFHCPYTREDANRFWHLASDDGIPASIKNWHRLQRSLTVPAVQQYQALGIEPISFKELLCKEQSQRDK